MRISNEHGFIRVELLDYAFNEPDYVCNLFDIRNSVEIHLGYNIDELGWGSVGSVYFLTKDIQSLSVLFSNLLFGRQNEMCYKGDWPYPMRDDRLEYFYQITVTREQDMFTFSMRIHDLLCDYITVTEYMNIDRFEEIQKEFKDAARKFPVIEK